MSILKIDNLSFNYNDNKILKNISFSVEKGEWLSIVGPNGSGKTTITKIITGIIKTNSSITVENLSLDKNLNKIKPFFGIVGDNPDNSLFGITVLDNLTIPLENLAIKRELMDNYLTPIITQFNLLDILHQEVSTFSSGDKQKIAIASALVHKPKILILDESLGVLDNHVKSNILLLLKFLQKNSDLTIISVTHNLNETLQSDRILVLNDGEIKAIDKRNKIYSKEKLLVENKLKLPFMIELSSKLMFYDLIDEYILDMESMVKKIWK